MVKNLLETHNLSKTYHHENALNRVSIHVPENQVYCLIGPNGAGKTTIMKIITGIIRPISGKLEFAGHPWCRQDLKSIGSLIEDAPLYGNLTAKENLEVITRLRGVSSERVDEILKSVGLNEVGKKLARNFSLGMKQRLGIGLALVDNPKLLILDEPTNGLDPLGIQELRTLIEKLKKQDITILISSHMLSEVEHLADYIGIIGNGKLLLEKSYDHHENLEKLFNKILQKKGENSD